MSNESGGIFENLPDGGKYLKVDGPVVIESDSLFSHSGFGTSVATGLSAAGSAIGDALQLSHFINVLGTVGSGTGAKLFSAPVGATVHVVNGGANALALYPENSSGVINGGSPAASVAVAAGELAICLRTSATGWQVRVAVAP